MSEAGVTVTSTDLIEPRPWGGGCAAWVLTDAPNLLVAEERMPPGAAEVRHRHVRATQTFYVLDGVLVVEALGTRRTVAARQAATVRAGVPHRVVNESAHDAVFLAIAGPSTRGDRIDPTEA